VTPLPPEPSLPLVQVRKFAQSYIKPGIKLVEMCEKLEDMNRFLVGERGQEVCWGLT